jgi:hypothetical protein
MRSAFFVLIGFAVLLPAQTAFEFTGRYWIPQMSARLRVERNGFGTDIDAKQDLGISDTNFPEGQFTLETRHMRVQFTYTPIDLSGDRTVTRTIVFNGRTYALGTRVVSDLEVQHLQLSWAWQFINLRDGIFKIGPMVEADGFLTHGRLRAPDLSFDERENVSAGLPTVGIALDINPHRRVNIYGQVAGMKADDYAYFIGSDAGVKVRPVRFLVLAAGYRTFNLHLTTAPDFARLNLRGPFVGAGIRF